MKYFIINIFLLLLANEVLAQYTPGNDGNKQSIKLVYTNSDGTVRLRWAPLDQDVWELGITHGYIIERKTISLGNNKTNTAKTIRLAGGVVMPAAKSIWEKECEFNDKALIIADAFYGDIMSQNGGTVSPTAVFLNSMVEVDDKFTFSLLAADLDYKAALLAGWGYTDTDVLPNAVYEYTVRLNYPQLENIVRDTIVVNMSRKTTPPVPVGVDVSFEESVAKISWLQHLYDQPVVAYNIERSLDNKNFSTLNQKPFLSSGKGPALYNDTIPNNTFVYYRLRSIDCFGEISNPSKAVAGEAKRELSAAPNNVWHTYLNYDTLTIHWDFDPAQNDLVIGFEVYKSESSRGNYENISFFLPVASRSFNVPASDRNYIIVKAVGKGSYSTASVPYFAPRPDVVPPLQPKGLTGSIDSSGVISLKWNANSDKDLEGYLLYASHLNNDIYVPVTKNTFAKTSFTDSINMKSGYRNKFFKVVAVDSAGNHSEPSDILKIAIPDMIKPIAPLIRKMYQRIDTIRIEWMPSISDDVQMQLVYRKERDEQKWRVVKSFNDNVTKSFEDTGLENGKTFSYLILAVDSANLESEPSNPATFSVSYQTPPDNIEGLTAKFNQKELTIELGWKNLKNCKGYQLYKDEGEGDNFYYCSFINASENKYIDKNIKPFKSYNYKIRVVSKEGLYSRFESIRVEWK